LRSKTGKEKLFSSVILHLSSKNYSTLNPNDKVAVLAFLCNRFIETEFFR
jgi:hypothetical protein